MICRVGLFRFDAHSIIGLDETLKTPYAKHNRPQNHPLFQEVGKSEEEITIRGLNVKAKVSDMRWLKEQAKLKIPVRFTTETSSFWVIVDEIRTSKSEFFKGVWIYERFTIRMRRHYPEYNSIIDDIIGALL